VCGAGALARAPRDNHVPPDAQPQTSLSFANPVLSFPRVSDATLKSPTPQFGSAEYVGSPGDDHCQFCHQPITATYFRVNDAMACLGCTEKARGELAKDTHAAYMRGLLYGVGAAVVGMILYATFAIMTGIIIGYVSLAVGWMVGNAILKGSGGVGGRRYQITAVLLTYCAVSMAAVPVWIHYAGKQKQTQEQDLAARQRQLEKEFGQQGQPVIPAPNKARPSVAGAIAMLALIGIASPFIEIWEAGPSFGTIIGFAILIVGIRVAWRITAGRPLEIYGPFTNSVQPIG
jgi:hypothetical protein